MKIALTGDVMLGRLVNDHMRHASPEYFWGSTLPLIRSADFSIINLECALTASDSPWARTPKVFFFKADPERAIAVLNAAGVKFANLANNHVLDYELQGMKGTTDALRQAGIGFCGAGMNIEQAARPEFVEAGGLRIAVIGATDNTPEWQAAERLPGVNYIQINEASARALAASARSAREQADLLIFSVHWGPYMRERPKQDSVDFAHIMIENGVDVIHGHSAHLFQGIEIRNGKVIIYDAGDYIDDYAVDPVLRNDRSFLFVLDVEDDGTIAGVSLHPTVIDFFQVNLAAGKDRQEILRRMQMLCAEMGTRAVKANRELHVDVQGRLAGKARLR